MPELPVFREKALALTEQMATRYADHPAVVLWHVSNELGCHNAHCYCDVSAEAFRRWLADRYGDVASLNDAWGTAFWSQRYADWEEVLPPRLAPTFPNPTQQLDFRRFSSDELLSYYVAERDVLRRHSPEVPVTTNFMVMAHFDKLDYRAWAPEMDVVSNDHYMLVESPDPHVELAFSADATRGLASGAPWLLMEHSTSAVNWQPRNVAKLPGELVRNSLQHVARGADGVCFFQWRASRAGAEKFHSGLVPHAGTDTKVWREVVQLGAALDSLAEVAGTRWSPTSPSSPTGRPGGPASSTRIPAPTSPTSTVRTPSIARCGTGASPPTWWGPTPTSAATGSSSCPRCTSSPTRPPPGSRQYVAAGGTALVTYFSGIVDEHDHVRLGGYPGAYRELLGLRVEEFFPLRQGEQVVLDDGSQADVWTELLHLDGATAVASYTDGPLPGVPAVTRNRFGDGTAWYLGTRLDGAATARLVDRLLADTGIEPPVAAVPGLEVVTRADDASTFVFLLNHTTSDHDVDLEGRELITGETVAGSLRVPAGAVRVVRRTTT